MKKFLCISLFISTAFPLAAQLRCDKSLMYGEWKLIGTKEGSSLEKTKEISSAGQIRGIYTFSENGTWTFKSYDTTHWTPKQRIRPYFVNEKTCELNLRKRKYRQRREQPRILLLTKDTLVFTAANPHYNYVRLLIR